MNITKVMREACLPVAYVGSSSNPAPRVQPFGNLNLSFSKQNKSEVESFGLIPPRNPKTLERVEMKEEDCSEPSSQPVPAANPTLNLG